MPDLKSESGSAAQENRPATPPSNGRSAGPDPLARLYHMSTTAGVGTQEYVAINSTAIAALILGISSVLALLHPVLLVIPIAGAICAVLAFIQIRDSNGTQTGRALAGIGLLLAFAFGAGKGGYDVYQKVRTRGDERQISQLIEQFGQSLAAGNYDQGYDLFTERFRNRVDRISFEATFRQLEQMRETGALDSVIWNKEPMAFERGDDNRQAAAAMTFMHWRQQPTPGSRIMFQFLTEGGRWRINDISAVFPAQKPKKNAPVEGP